MANEKLTSSVFYQGTKVGTADLTVVDTSFYPEYDFTLIEQKSQAVVQFNALQQLNAYTLKFKQVAIASDLNKVYASVRSPDGKFFAQANSAYGVEITDNFEFALDTNGAGELNFGSDFYPSLLGYTAEFSFYHDSAKTLLIRSFTLSVKAVTTASLNVLPTRNASRGNNPLWPTYIESGEDVTIAVSSTGAALLSGTRNGKFSGKVGSTEFPDGDVVIATVNQMNIDFSNTSSTATSGNRQLPTKEKPANLLPQVLNVKMGELTVGSSIRQKSYIDALAWNNTARIVVPLYRREATLAWGINPVMIAQGQSLTTSTVNRRGPVVIEEGAGTNVWIDAQLPTYGAAYPSNYGMPHVGPITALTWKPSLLSNANNRLQFGKFQATWLQNVNSNDINSQTIKWATMSNPIADAAYGTPSTLAGSDIVVLVQPYKRTDRIGIWLDATANREFSVREQGFDSAGVAKTYDGLVSFLVLRRSEMLDTYPTWVPYPRVIKADRVTAPTKVDTTQAKWSIDIPTTSAIDLREPRYVIQITDELTTQSGTVRNSDIDYRIVKTKSNITIYGNYKNTNPDPKHYAIWDLGPETATGNIGDGRLRGLVKYSKTQPWVMRNLSPNYIPNVNTVVIMPTIGGSTQVMRDATFIRSTSDYKLWGSYTDVNGARYDGEVGTMVWSKLEITTLERRNQFPGYQYSKVIDYNSANGVSTIPLSEVNESLSSSLLGPLTSLKDPDLLMFINAENSSNWDSTYWSDSEARIGINYGQGSYSGKVSVLFLRKTGWTQHAAGTNYPRIVFTDAVDLGADPTYNLTLDKSIVDDPLDSRYQLLAQVRPMSTNDSWIKYHYAKLTRSSNTWRIDLTGGGTANRLQIAIVDYGPGISLLGQASVAEVLIDKTYSKVLPSGVLSSDPLYSIQGTFGHSQNGSGSSGYQVEALTNYGVRRSEESGDITAWFQGQWLDITYGGSRYSSRGALAWARNGNIGKALKAQVPCIQARHHSAPLMHPAYNSPSGIAWGDLEEDLASTGSVLTSFNDSEAVIIPVVDDGGNRFKYWISDDGKSIIYKNSDGDGTMPMEGTNQTNTLILKKQLTMPSFPAGTPYPRVIYANKEAFVNRYSVPAVTINLSDSSYASVDLNNGRYQMVRAMQSTNSVRGLNGYNGGGASAGKTWLFQLLTNQSYRADYGWGCYLHYMIVDYGPDYANV